MKSKSQKLQKKAEALWKACCWARDGKRCMVKEFDYAIEIAHTNIFQVDHCFSRTNKHLFLDVKNGTSVCSTCNMLKGFGQKSVHRIIDEIVRQREGQEAFNKMLLIDQCKNPNLQWNQIPWLELQIARLEKELANLMERK